MSRGLTPEQAIPELEKLWDFEGFFGRLRQGDYDKNGVGMVEQLLGTIQVDDGTALPRRFVSMTWWIPTFMEWQVERVEERGGDVEQLKRDVVRLRNVLDSLLGVP
jgi:hypothetical protein